MLTRHQLQQKITLLEPFTGDDTAEFAVSVARELLNYMDKMEIWRNLWPLRLNCLIAAPARFVRLKRGTPPV